MAVIQIPDEKRTLNSEREVADYLATIGVQYERWEAAQAISVDASNEEILAAYSGEIEALKAQGGYVTADVVDVSPETPGLDAMLAKFNKEHWHDEDEVRFIIAGRGIFHIHPPDGLVVAIEVGPGDLIRVPRGTHHWFDLCSDRRIRAIRLFQNPAGWTPQYTDTLTENQYQTVCLGPAYFPPAGLHAQPI